MNRSQFAFHIDRWDRGGQTILMRVAGVENLLVAMAAYEALARRDHNATPRRQSHRGQSHRAVGVNVVSPSLSLSLWPWEPFLRRAC